MKKKITLAFAIVLLGLQFLAAQTPIIDWSMCYGGTSGDVGRCIQQTRDNGFIIVGNSSSSNGDVYKNEGSEDCWIVKLNHFGDTVWTRVFGGNSLDFAMAVEQTEDDGFIIAAQSKSNDGDFVGGSTSNYDCWIIKLDKTGITQWKKRFGGSGDDVPRDMLQTSDSGFIVIGSSKSKNGDVWGNHGGYDYWILRLNKIGDTLWSKSYGGTANDIAFSIYRTTDNGYLLTGQSDSKNGDVWGNQGKTDYWVLKINSIGDTLWTKSFGGKEDDLGHTILQTMDGGYVVGGSSQSNNGDVSGHHGDSSKADIWIVKMNSNNKMQWQKSIGGTQNEALYGNLLAFSMLETTDSGFLIASYTLSNDGDVAGNNGSSDVWLIKLKNSGNIEWQRALGGTGSDYGHSVKSTNDGGYVVSGWASTNSGDVSGNHGGVDLWVVKFKGNASFVENRFNTKLVVYPNPANKIITIGNGPIGAKVQITSIAGKIIYNSEIYNELTTINIADFACGTYVLKIEKIDFIEYRKLIVQ